MEESTDFGAPVHIRTEHFQTLSLSDDVNPVARHSLVKHNPFSWNQRIPAFKTTPERIQVG